MSQPRAQSVPVPAPPRATPSTEQTQWFEREVQPHDGQLKAYLRGSFPSVRDVEDVVQESYLRIWKARASHPIQSAKAFLFKVARHIALDTIRKLHRSPIQTVGDLDAFGVIEDGQTDPAVVAARLEAKMDLLADAIAALPVRRREIVLLRKFDRLSQKEVARQLNLSERTVENQLHRALRQCEIYLRGRGVNDLYSDET